MDNTFYTRENVITDSDSNTDNEDDSTSDDDIIRTRFSNMVETKRYEK